MAPHLKQMSAFLPRFDLYRAFPTRMKVQAFLSAPAERHAEQPLPSPGSPEHLILRFLHLEHFRFVSQAGFPPSCGK